MPVVTQLTEEQMIDMVQDVPGDTNSVEIVVPDVTNDYRIYFKNEAVFGPGRILRKPKDKFTRTNAAAGQTPFYIAIVGIQLPTPIPYIKHIPPRP